jgi:hypothetical protein
MDVRGKRNLAEQISNAILEALSGLDVNIAVNNNMDGEVISEKLVRRRLARITSFR